MEIQLDRPFSQEEESLIDMHSVLNVLNVILYELILIEEYMAPCAEVQQLHEITVDAARSLSDKKQAYNQVASIGAYIAKVTEVLNAAARERNMQDSEFFRNHMENVQSIFNILQVRAKEIVARSADPMAWVAHDIGQLKANFMSVFRAIERNSHGGYRIVYNLAEHEDEDYLVLFEISSVEDPKILMPAVFQDVMRDLLANARKYTLPGGMIQSGLYNSGKELRFVVSDTGCGIPEDEILKVVEFGVRGSNVSERPTRGGGFGLTKAYYVTRLFGGRMWIFSKGVPGRGTRVEIRIPCPPEMQQKARAVLRTKV